MVFIKYVVKNIKMWMTIILLHCLHIVQFVFSLICTFATFDASQFIRESSYLKGNDNNHSDDSIETGYNAYINMKFLPNVIILCE